MHFDTQIFIHTSVYLFSIKFLFISKNLSHQNVISNQNLKLFFILIFLIFYCFHFTRFYELIPVYNKSFDIDEITILIKL